MKTIQEITVGTIAARINGLATAVAKKEAATCLKSIENKEFEYPICFDIENKT